MKNKKLKLARVERDLSQEDLAIWWASPGRTIGLIEAGNYNPTPAAMRRHMQSPGKTLDDLFWEETE